MRFSEKLSFLMDITKTTNSTLSRHVLLDASYISRLRRGKRLLPRNADSVKNMAAYFARHCKEGYRQKAVGDALGLSPLPQDTTVLTDAIARWLLAGQDGGAETVGQFLDGLSGMQNRNLPAANLQKNEAVFSREELAVYYGVEGKRQAVLYFLSEVIAQDKPQTLLLFSDEETSWMTADPAFTRQWAVLMAQVLSQGHRIKIIHTVSRNLDEMLDAIGQWMPLYMAGTIEPYFYPKKRDGLFKRTLFIAPGTAAVVSGSVGEHTGRAVNLLFRNPTAVAAYEEEYLQYLRLCRPLMRIFKAKDKADCLSTLAKFEKKRGNALVKTESLSLLTMPEALFSQMLARAGTPGLEMLDFHRSRAENLRQLLRSHDFTEIVVLPEPKDVMAGKVKVALSDMLGGGAIHYTPGEYLLHLQNIMKLLDIYENYHVHLVRGPIEDLSPVYVKEELGAIVAKTSQPPVVLAMSEGNMIASFWDFLKKIIGEKAYENPNNKAVINYLQAYRKNLNHEAEIYKLESSLSNDREIH